MVSGLQAAKDAWDKGLVGTDDFKSFAKLISPSGATDDVNFAENYAKAARYLTEDESGVKAFLNDLSSKGLADFNEESQQWSYNVKDMAEAAKQMGMGKDFMSNMFGRLEDYGFHNNVISDAEDGVLKLSDAYSNLAESEARLEDLKKNDPTNTTRQKDMIDAINAMAEKWIAKADQMLQQPTKTEGVLEEVEQKPDKDNVAEGNPTPYPPKVSDDESIRDAVLVDPDEPKKKPNKNDNKKTGNGKAEVGDKVTFSSGRYYEASDGSGASGNMYLGKKVKITRINKGSKYPYAIDATDGTELGWVKLNQLKGYASGIMRVPNDQLAWTQEQGEEAIVRNDGSILTPLSRDVSVLNADMTKNLWDFMGNPGSFLNNYSDGEKFGVKNIDNSSSVDVGGVTIQCNMPNVQNANDLLHELTTNKDIEKAICAMTIGRAMGGSSLAKYKYKK